jgi:galactose oxidase
MELGNAWHNPANAERSPIFPLDPKLPITIFSGNQFQDDKGNSTGNQLGEGSVVKYKKATKNDWTSVDMKFANEIGNNKYFRAEIRLDVFAVGDEIQYYLILPYSDKKTTFLGAAVSNPKGMYSGVLPTEDAAQASPFTFTIGPQNDQTPFALSTETEKEQGKWSKVYPLLNVAAHAHLLHTGMVLMWGRRDNPSQSMNSEATSRLNGKTMKPASCTPFIVDPLNLESKGDPLDPKLKGVLVEKPFMPDGFKSAIPLPAPLSADNGKTNANLFCSSHTFLPNGNLFVAGGHIVDSSGLDQSCIYEPNKDPQKSTWKCVPAKKKDGTVMGNGRWYPTVTALPSGVPLVVSGTFQEKTNIDTQILSLENDVFASVVPKPPNELVFDLYPRMQVASSGIIYLISLSTIWFLDLDTTPRQWKPIAPPPKDPVRALRDYACSVMYYKDKVAYIGGGNPPTATTDLLDLSNPSKIVWKNVPGMNFPRRQHNATILPDGTVLVTGGTRGDGAGATENGGDAKFNDLRDGRPVRVAELWDPTLMTWKEMASEQIDRCYHSTAVLLQDGRVLSAGGGEFQLNGQPNLEKDSHLDMQIFSPPYLFLDGPRPKIESISKVVIECGSPFEIGTADPDQIGKINLIGLSSVTHSNNTGQRLVPLGPPLTPVQKGKPIIVRAPPDAKACPPGYYMLFIVNKKGKPSEGKMVQIVPTAAELKKYKALITEIMDMNKEAGSATPTVLARRQAVREADNGTRVELGITSTCPYGLSACWGGAFEALSNLTSVKRVDPIPHASGSTASVFLADNGLPDLDLWTKEFKNRVRETYALRGFEAAVTGTVERRENGIVLAGDGVRPEVSLVRLGPEGKVQWDKDARRPHLVTDEEAAAYDGLVQSASSGSAGPVTVTGPLSQTEAGYMLQVRLIKR